MNLPAINQGEVHLFERQIQLQWWMFAGAGPLTLLIALGTVFLHAFLKAGINPVLAIKTE